MLPQALLQHRFALRQLLTVVDPIDLIGIGDLHMHGFGQHRHGVGEVELTLVVVGAQLGQHLCQGCPVEAINPVSYTHLTLPTILLV